MVVVWAESSVLWLCHWMAVVDIIHEWKMPVVQVPSELMAEAEAECLASACEMASSWKVVLSRHVMVSCSKQPHTEGRDEDTMTTDH